MRGIKFDNLDPATQAKIKAMMEEQERSEKLEKPDTTVIQEEIERVENGSKRFPFVKRLAQVFFFAVVGIALMFVVKNWNYYSPNLQPSPTTTVTNNLPVTTQTVVKDTVQVQTKAQELRETVKEIPRAKVEIKEAPAITNEETAGIAPKTTTETKTTQQQSAINKFDFAGTPSPFIASGKINKSLFGGGYYVSTTIMVASLYYGEDYKTINGIIDSGASVTSFPDEFLRSLGHTPIARSDVKGVNSETTTAYKYKIPYPCIYSEHSKEYGVLGYGEIEVWGIVGFDKALIGADILRHNDFTVTGDQWLLQVLPENLWR